MDHDVQEVLMLPEIKMIGNEITVTFSEEEQKRARLTIAGKLEHFQEIRDNFKTAAQRDDLDQIPLRLKKYEGYKEIEITTATRVV